MIVQGGDMMQGRIHSFESFGTVDGPGIRFIIFMQGCPLRCLYCHNPDSWQTNGGKLYEIDEILPMILKYKNYFGNNGGVTVSGGEPLLQIDFVTQLFIALKKEGIHTCIDTSGITFNEDDTSKFDLLIDNTDLFLLDIKHISSLEHQNLTGMPNEKILKFAYYLDRKKKNIWIRHVLVPGYTNNTVYLMELRRFLDTLTNVAKIEVLPYHTMGIVKYQKLNIPYKLGGVSTPSKEDIALANKILKGGYKFNDN